MQPDIILIVLAAIFFTVVICAFIGMQLYLKYAEPPPPSARTPEDHDQNAVLLRAKKREFEARAEHDEAELKALTARTDLENIRSLIKQHSNGGRL